jgi:quercetin dioxygenase-like cupin family protein
MSVPYLARADARQQILWLGGSVHGVVLDGAATENRLAMFRSSMREGAASPVHVHDRDDEAVFVLDGTGVFWAGDHRWELGSGDAAYLPRGVPHTYLVTSDTLDMITVCNPAGIEEFFRSVGWDLSDPQPADWTIDMEALRDAAKASQQRVLGPPLAAGDDMPASYLGSGRSPTGDNPAGS